MTDHAIALPELPVTPYLLCDWSGQTKQNVRPVYTADQMRQYALDAIAAHSSERTSEHKWLCNLCGKEWWGDWNSSQTECPHIASSEPSKTTPEQIQILRIIDRMHRSAELLFVSKHRREGEALADAAEELRKIAFKPYSESQRVVDVDKRKLFSAIQCLNDTDQVAVFNTLGRIRMSAHPPAAECVSRGNVTSEGSLLAPRGVCHCPEQGNWIAADDVNRLVRELDVAINGKEGRAKQASLCDIVSQVVTEGLVAPREDINVQPADVYVAPGVDGEVKPHAWMNPTNGKCINHKQMFGSVKVGELGEVGSIVPCSEYYTVPLYTHPEPREVTDYLITRARKEFRDSDAAGDVLDWLEEALTTHPQREVRDGDNDAVQFKSGWDTAMSQAYFSTDPNDRIKPIYSIADRVASLIPQPSAPVDDANAKRYEWLKANGKPAVEYLAMACPETWDERIDFAMKSGLATQRAEGKDE